MSSFGLLSVKLHSLSPAPCTSAPAPWRPPSSIPHPPPIVRVFFNGVMKRRPPWNPTSLSSVQEGPKSPGEFPILLTLPSSLPPPLGRSLERQLVEGPETGTFGGATPGDPFLPITNPIRKAGWPRSTVSTLRLQLGRIGVGRTGSPGGGED